MTGIMGKWPSRHGQPSKNTLPDSCREKTITMAAQFDCDRYGFEGYPGNVGLMESDLAFSGRRKAGYGQRTGRF